MARWTAALAATLALGLAAAPCSADDQLLVYDASLNASVVAPDGTAAGPSLGKLGAGAAWSQDGAQIIARVPGGIEVMNADGTNRRTIAGTMPGSVPVFSPDASRYAVFRNGDLLVESLTGGAATTVTHPAPPGFAHVAWSSQDEIAYETSHSPPYAVDVNVIRPDGSGDRTVLSLPQPVVDGRELIDQVKGMSFSPDGRTLAVAHQVGTGFNMELGRAYYDWHITTVAVQPGGVASDRVVGSGYSENGPYHVSQGFTENISFAPDGNRIAVADVSANQLRLAVYDLASGGYSYPGAATNVFVAWRPQPTPVIFIHGFLGSRISCSGSEAWPNIPPRPKLLAMQLGPDGLTSPCAVAAAGEAGLVTTISLGSIGLSDVYGSTVDFLKRAAPGRYHVYSWDWRKSPEQALAGLDQLVDRVRAGPTGKVVLMAHSMGGLVTRWYVDDPQRAAKVARAVTIGTPYWGSAKALFPLAAGVETPSGSVLDALFFNNSELQRFARNLQGMYYLWPSDPYGGWLTDLSQGSRPLSRAGVLNFTANVLGGNRALLQGALAGHASHLDALRTNGVDYHVVVGTGKLTIERVRILPMLGGRAMYEVDWRNGDGTVPRTSANLGGTAPANRLHYVCGVPHVPLPGDAGVTRRIKDFLLEGKPIDDSGTGNDCAASGFEFRTFSLALGSGAARGRGAAGATAMTLDDAQARGLIQRLDLGPQQIFATDGSTPVRLKVDGRSGIVVTPLRDGKAGKPSYVAPVPGEVVIDAGATATLRRAGKILKPLRTPDRTAPRTTVAATRRGSRVLLRFRATDRSGVAATYLTVGKRAARRVRGSITVGRAQLRTVRFQSIDVFGNVERPRRVRAG